MSGRTRNSDLPEYTTLKVRSTTLKWVRKLCGVLQYGSGRTQSSDASILRAVQKLCFEQAVKEGITKQELSDYIATVEKEFEGVK